MFEMLLNPAGYKYLTIWMVSRWEESSTFWFYVCIFFIFPMSVRNFVEMLLQLKCEGRNWKCDLYDPKRLFDNRVWVIHLQMLNPLRAHGYSFCDSCRTVSLDLLCLRASQTTHFNFCCCRGGCGLLDAVLENILILISDLSSRHRCL